MNYILFDDYSWKNLLPLTYTRPIANLRIGIITIVEKWEKYLNKTVSYLTQKYLSKKFSIVIHDDNILINGSVIPNKNIVTEIAKLKQNEVLMDNSDVIAIRINRKNALIFS